MDQPIPLDRREVLKATTGILTGLVIAGSPLAIMARGSAWAGDLTAILNCLVLETHAHFLPAPYSHLLRKKAICKFSKAA